MGRKKGILWRQVTLYSLVFFLFVTGLSILVYDNIQDFSQRINYMLQQGHSGTLLLQTDTFLDPMYQTAAQVSYDTEIIHMMQQTYAQEQDANHNFSDEEANKRLSEILSSHNAASTNDWRIAVYDTTGDYLCDDPQMNTVHLGHDASRLETFTNQLQASEDRPYTFLIPTPDPYTDQDALYFALVLPITSSDGSSTYGYVEIQQKSSMLHEHLRPYTPETLDVFLFYSWDQDREFPVYRSRNPYPHERVQDYTRTVYYSEYGWDIVLLRDQNTLLEDFDYLIVFLLACIAGLYVLLLVCVYLVARYTNKPILKLNNKVKQVTLDHIPDGSVTDNATDEVKELEQSFDLMVQRLNTSFQLEKKAYLNALQAQMNPHFLYNCLSNIAGMCIVGHTENIPEFCYFLADILRYESTYDDNSVTLKDELENVTNYLELMKLRYENDFEYHLHADESLLELPIPRLMLQPIVENCFEHGFRDMAPPWRIFIHVFREGRQWCITVQDNGCGFDAEKRQQIFAQVDSLMGDLGQNHSELQIGGLGLVNTILRLRLVTDDRLFYSITPAESGGTIVTLKGALHDESPDRG